MTIELTRVPAPLEPPIVVEEVHFTSADGVELAGTLALPAGPGPHPAIVLVQGRSYGPRDQFRGHAILAARRGIAALAFDGRGMGASGGSAEAVTLTNRLDDAQAALELLRGDARVDAERVGLFGHSSGGWVVPVVAQRAGPVAFLVLHSGPAEPLGEQQGRVMQVIIEQRSGRELDPSERASILACYSALSELSARQAPWSEIEPVVEAARAEPWAEHVRLPTSLDDANLDYYRRCPHDSTEALRATRAPVLALYGSDDFVVQVDVNAPLLEQHLRAAGNEDFEIVVFRGADHDLMIPEVEAEGVPYRWQRRPPRYFETLLDWTTQRVLPD
jgi:dienelactone hydrolase